jgi:hypothetical protein
MKERERERERTQKRKRKNNIVIKIPCMHIISIAEKKS